MSELEFQDISDEQYREYAFLHERAVIYMRVEGVKLHVSKSGGHRIIDANGYSHYIPPKWVAITWKPKAGKPNFAF